MEQPSFRATLIVYVAFSFFSSSGKFIEQQSLSDSALDKNKLVIQLNFIGLRTTDALGDDVPVDDSRLNCAKKLEKE